MLQQQIRTKDNYFHSTFAKGLISMSESLVLTEFGMSLAGHQIGRGRHGYTRDMGGRGEGVKNTVQTARQSVTPGCPADDTRPFVIAQE